jgi:hypothetical protein
VPLNLYATVVDRGIVASSHQPAAARRGTERAWLGREAIRAGTHAADTYAVAGAPKAVAMTL